MALLDGRRRILDVNGAYLQLLARARPRTMRRRCKAALHVGRGIVRLLMPSGIYRRSRRPGSRYDACGDIRPITWPSGSLKSPITIPTPGTSSGPIILVPPRLSAFSSAAPTSATWT